MLLLKLKLHVLHHSFHHDPMFLLNAAIFFQTSLRDTKNSLQANIEFKFGFPKQSTGTLPVWVTSQNVLQEVEVVYSDCLTDGGFTPPSHGAVWTVFRKRGDRRSFRAEWVHLQSKSLNIVPSWWNALGIFFPVVSCTSSCDSPSSWAADVRLGLIPRGRSDGCVTSSCWLVVCCRHLGPPGRRSGQTKVSPAPNRNLMQQHFFFDVFKHQLQVWCERFEFAWDIFSSFMFLFHWCHLLLCSRSSQRFKMD